MTNGTISTYLEQTGPKKLQLGCGHNTLSGWLNSDARPIDDEIAQINVTEPFPIADDSFDYVFSEHMIEHVTYEQGQVMLEESFRVLKPGGTLRVSTPDMAFLVSLYQSEKTPLQEAYLKWAVERFIPEAPQQTDTFVINNFVRAWGHRFIYDEKTLRQSLETVGFSNIVSCSLNDSSDEELRHLEHDGRMPKGFLQLESFTLEATK